MEERLSKCGEIQQIMYRSGFPCYMKGLEEVGCSLRIPCINLKHFIDCLKFIDDLSSPAIMHLMGSIDLNRIMGDARYSFSRD